MTSTQRPSVTPVTPDHVLHGPGDHTCATSLRATDLLGRPDDAITFEPETGRADGRGAHATGRGVHEQAVADPRGPGR